MCSAMHRANITADGKLFGINAVSQVAVSMSFQQVSSDSSSDS